MRAHLKRCEQFHYRCIQYSRLKLCKNHKSLVRSARIVTVRSIPARFSGPRIEWVFVTATDPEVPSTTIPSTAVAVSSEGSTSVTWRPHTDEHETTECCLTILQTGVCTHVRLYGQFLLRMHAAYSKQHISTLETLRKIYKSIYISQICMHAVKYIHCDVKKLRRFIFAITSSIVYVLKQWVA